MRPSRITAELEKISDWPGLAREAGYCAYRLANLLDVQERALRRYFLKKFGRATHLQLEAMRQEKIEQLARAGRSEKDIAVELQFKQTSHLSRRFKAAHGVTLRLWLKSTSNSALGVTPFILSTMDNFIPL